MMDRRQWIGMALGAGAAIGLGPRIAFAEASAPLLARPIPSSGEKVPVIGLGSSATFRSAADSEDARGLGEVLKTMVERGATVFDTAPSYGASEEVAGRLARELGLTQKLFWATKVNVARGGGAADPAAARAQIEDSFRRFGVGTMDLIQVHNLGDVRTQLGILKELKAAKRVRYIGVTSTSKQQYAELARVMRAEPLDFIGVDYAVDNRSAGDEILPLALERRIAVMVYAPFGRTRLFQRVGERPLPAWAAGFDAASWAQFFLKYVLGHPAVTVVTPATSKARHMVDNLGGGTGRVPDEAARKRMAEFVDALPGDSASSS
ncbi:MAG TPA: aldo/keto reductase [Steroidobacteraceae bacterium]|nr:aldo/keto reductase [Steroidobacteraceae bacterium]